MNFFELKNISERYMDLLNPISAEKMVKVGAVLGLKPGDRVIDFGCGFGETLALWAEKFGISGIGIDIRPHACERARQRVSTLGLSERIQIVCADASEYRFEPHTFDAAVCIGATFIWDGFGPTLQALREAIQPKGKVAVGEAYWLSDSVPAIYARTERLQTEFELLQTTRQEGYDLEYIVRASHDDWDHYESGNWYGLHRWLEENRQHAEWEQVVQHLRTSQEEYLRYARQHFGWAIWVLNPALYG